MVLPLMPKATAVWLVENTALSFEQIAAFCKLHPLEVKGIADGEVAAGIKGLVTEGIRLAAAKHADIDHVIAIGPPIMMKGCADTTRPFGVIEKTNSSWGPSEFTMPRRIGSMNLGDS